MKTKTFLLLCLFLGIGLTQLSAQSNEKNINRSYTTRMEITNGIFPITCDGVDVDWLTCVGTLHAVDHVKNGVLQWEIDQVKWEATSTKTGEVFKGKELDKTVFTYIDPVTFMVSGYSIWRANMQGNMGHHYQITIDISFTPYDFTWSLIKTSCD
jgi:hypothetical protein